jgi:hypothetical protein
MTHMFLLYVVTMYCGHTESHTILGTTFTSFYFLQYAKSLGEFTVILLRAAFVHSDFDLILRS